MKKLSIKKIILLFLILAVLGSIALLCLLKYRSDINNTGLLKSYRLVKNEALHDTQEYYKDLCKDLASFTPVYSKPGSHLFLHMTATEQTANEYGFNLSGLHENGYIIACQGNGLYLMSKSRAGLNRAVFTLLYELTDKKGNLLLAFNDKKIDYGTSVRDTITVNGISLDSFNIVCPKDVPSELAYKLSYYMNNACGATPGIQREISDTPYLQLRLNSTEDAAEDSILVENNNIILSAATVDGLSSLIHRFANTTLGYLYAGTAKEKPSETNAAINYSTIPNQTSEPWIEEREAIITLWNINFSRGIFLNESTSLKTDVMSFSEDQLYEYVRMLKYCGYTGIQVTEMCSAWAGAGSYEFVHERIRILADAAHSLGMKFTLWVWGSEFTGYGWCDSSVTYSADGYAHAYENPAVLATFDKYYSIYAKLADCCDRLIAHFYDPGNLSDSADVAYFSKMLSEKFLAINPNIDFGVSCWIDAFSKDEYVRTFGNNITLYDSTKHNEGEKYNSFRSFTSYHQTRLGIWAWNTCEMEIDQLAQMNYNPHIIQNTYLESKAYDYVQKPTGVKWIPIM